MKFVSGKELGAGDLIVSMDRVTRLTHDPHIDNGTAHCIGYNNRNGFRESTTVGAASPVLVDEPVRKEIPGAGTVEVELAGVKNPHDPDSSWIYRHRVFDAKGQKIADELGPGGAPQDQTPDNHNALARLVNFLIDDAKLQEKVDRDEWRESEPVYSEPTRRWAQEFSDELEQVALELSEPELNLSEGIA